MTFSEFYWTWHVRYLFPQIPGELGDDVAIPAMRYFCASAMSSDPILLDFKAHDPGVTMDSQDEN
jgi:hypothetical protein